MKEPLSHVWLGIFAHLGSVFIFAIILNYVKWSFLNITTYFLITGLPFMTLVLILERIYPIVYLPPLILRDIVHGVIDTVFYGLIVGNCTLYGVVKGLEFLRGIRETHFNICNIILHIILIDLSYYTIHRWLYHSKIYKGVGGWFQYVHLPHHIIRYLDFVRGSHSSLLDNGVLGYQLFCAVWGYLLGLNMESILVSYYICLLLQIVHHCNYTFSISLLRYVFIDSHCHKLHHCIGGDNINFGGLLSVWDLLFGTFYENHDICANEIHINRDNYLKNCIIPREVHYHS